MKRTFTNVGRVTLEGGTGGDWLPVIAAVVAVLLLAGSATAVAAYLDAAWHVLKIMAGIGAALAFSAACGLFARWFGQREQRREMERLRAAEPQRIRWRQQ